MCVDMGSGRDVDCALFGLVEVLVCFRKACCACIVHFVRDVSMSLRHIVAFPCITIYIIYFIIIIFILLNALAFSIVINSVLEAVIMSAAQIGVLGFWGICVIAVVA